MRTLQKKAESYPFNPEVKSDIRDVLNFYKDGAKTWAYLSSRIQYIDLDDDDEDVQPEVCTTFDELDECFRTHLFWPQKSSDALAVCLAVIISVRVKGPLLWIYLIGPSGSGKSRICEALGADKIHTKRLNSMTGFHSGYKAEGGKDVSLLAKLLGKALIIPDFTSVLGMSSTAQEKIYAEMRNIFDGISSMHFGNDTEHEYTKITFPVVAGVTHEIHGLRRSAFGERFLKIDMTDTQHTDDIVYQTVLNVSNAASDSIRNNASFDESNELLPFMQEIKAKTLGFLNHTFARLHAGGSDIKLPEWFARKLVSLAAIVAAGRGEVNRKTGSDRDMSHRPHLETGTHPGGQLSKLSVCLAFLLETEPNDRIFRLVRKVALDTSQGFALEIIRALGHHPEGLTVDQLCQRIRLTPTTARKILEDLKELGVVVRQQGELEAGESHVLYLSDRLQRAYEDILGSRSEALGGS